MNNPVNATIPNPTPATSTLHPGLSKKIKQCARITALALLAFISFASTPISPAIFTASFLYGVARADAVHPGIQAILQLWKSHQISGSISIGIAILFAWNWVVPILGGVYAMYLGSTLDRMRRGIQN